ncbi:MAG TPA: diacylglycerol kinase family protein [Agriterribacter sp.]|nr:diacylglycerol kinase family protein [Agriterribacter sp.]
MKIIQSSKYACAGLITFFRRERNGKIQLVISALTVTAGLGLRLPYNKWIAILVCISMVLSMEMINTAIEKLCNLVHPDEHPQIKIVKDIAAGAVLLAAVISLIVGILIFLPAMISLF